MPRVPARASPRLPASPRAPPRVPVVSPPSPRRRPAALETARGVLVPRPETEELVEVRHSTSWGVSHHVMAPETEERVEAGGGWVCVQGCRGGMVRRRDEVVRSDDDVTQGGGGAPWRHPSSVPMTRRHDAEEEVGRHDALMDRSERRDDATR